MASGVNSNRRRNHDDILIFCLMMLASTFGIGMWALGQWLRRKGFGPQLDALDHTRHYSSGEPIALPAAAHFTAAWVCLIACHFSAARIRWYW
jgi:hypothetical protein